MFHSFYIFIGFYTHTHTHKRLLMLIKVEFLPTTGLRFLLIIYIWAKPTKP